jgi:hypothetical protein
MSFLHLQLAVAGLACVGIPILIHLLMRRRRRPVMWGAMRFLLEAYKKNRRRLMIEKWLLLATRCLLVALLGLAIGRPLVGALVGGASGRTVYLLVDNGLTSGVGAGDQNALARHKDMARRVLDSLSGSGSDADRAAMVALGSPADGVVLPPSADVPAVASLVQALSRTDSRADLPGALALVAAAIETDRARAGSAGARAGQTIVVILSDFLEGSADVSASLAKLPAGVRVLASTPSGSGAGNVAITGVEPLRSVVVVGTQGASGSEGATGGGGGGGGGGDQVRVMLRRFGPSVAQTGSTDIVLRLAGVRERAEQATLAEVGRASVRWAAGQETATASLQATRRGPGAGAETGRGSLTEVLEVQALNPGAVSGGDNSIGADDVWRRPVEVRDALRVGIVAPRRFGPRERVDRLDASEWLRLALQPGDDAGVEVTELDPSLLDGARLAGLDAVCVPRPDLLAAEHWPRLRLFLESGGMLLVMPPADVQVHLWSDAMVKEFGLPWQVAREAKVFGEAGGSAPPATIISAAAPGASEQGLLSLIQSELTELSRAVSVWKVLGVQTERNEGERLLSLSDGTALVLAQTYGGAGAQAASGPVPDGAARVSERGLVVYLAVAPDLGWTDLPAKPLMVPLVQELVREGVGRAHGSWWSIAGARPGVPGRSAELRRVELVGGTPGDAGDDAEGTSSVPVDEAGMTGSPLRRAGLWRAVDERGGERGVVAVNPDTRGSRTSAQDSATLEQWLGRASPDAKVAWISDDGGGASSGSGGGGAGGKSSIASLLARESAGSPISLPLLIAALVVAVFELWLARWASHAGVSAPTARKGAPA